MFGKKSLTALVASFVLLGFFVYILRLYATDNLNLYIHPRYTVFTVIMASLGLLLLLAGLVLRYRSKLKYKQIRLTGLDAIVVIVVVLAVIMPPQVLSIDSVNRKTLTTPVGQGVRTTCPVSKPDTLEAWVSEIAQYPTNCYEDEPIEITGFVIDAPDEPLPDDMYYLGRIVLSCCVIDARPFALPIEAVNGQTYQAETWLRVSGVLKEATVNGQERLVIRPSSVDEIPPPEQQYDYINVGNPDQFSPL